MVSEPIVLGHRYCAVLFRERCKCVFATFHIGLDKLKAAYFSFRPGHTGVGAVRKE
jgi:hypothetical protein